MKKVSIPTMAMCVALLLSACEKGSAAEELFTPEATPCPDYEDRNENANPEEDIMTTRMKISVGGHILTATLEKNATAQAFAAKLPITLPMMDLYEREMCYRFSEALPAYGARTRGYEVGEIVYYPPRHSLVIMYAQNEENFLMQSVGRVEGNVFLFDGMGDVDVRFEKAE